MQGFITLHATVMIMGHVDMKLGHNYWQIIDMH